MATNQPDYDVKPNFGTLFDKHRQLPFKRFMDVIGAKLDDLIELIDRPTPYDQGPGREIPYAVPVWYGPIPLTSSGVATNTVGSLTDQLGFQQLATPANPSKFIVPRDGDILIDQEFSLHVKSLNVYGFVSWGYKSDPGFTVPVINPNGLGDILDAVGTDPTQGPNGGAMPLDFFGGTFSTLSGAQPNLPNISFDIELYDRQRGRRMHDNKLPSQMFAGGRYAHRKTASPLVFPKGAKIEPRLFVNEVRMGSVLDSVAIFNAAAVKAYVCIVFKGTQHIEIPNI